VYPEDKVTKDGKPFWSLPKRPPTPLDFDPTNLLHCKFVAAAASMIASVAKIPIEHPNPRSDEAAFDWGQLSLMFDEEMPVFIPDDSKS